MSFLLRCQPIEIDWKEKKLEEEKVEEEEEEVEEEEEEAEEEEKKAEEDQDLVIFLKTI